MLSVDLHSHSFFSNCGVNSCIEMLTEAKRRGLKALAITDHGPILKGRISESFFKRMDNYPVDGIRLIKGLELNPINDQGETDCPLSLLSYLDIVLLGLHENIDKSLSENEHTEIIEASINRNRYIDIITHPDQPPFKVNFNRLARCASERGIAIEINNSKLARDITPLESAEALIKACKENRCRIAVNSDAHSVSEIGLDSAASALLSRLGFPDELIVNRTLETTISFIEERRNNKTVGVSR